MTLTKSIEISTISAVIYKDKKKIVKTEENIIF